VSFSSRFVSCFMAFLNTFSFFKPFSFFSIILENNFSLLSLLFKVGRMLFLLGGTTEVVPVKLVTTCLTIGFTLFLIDATVGVILFECVLIFTIWIGRAHV